MVCAPGLWVVCRGRAWVVCYVWVVALAKLVGLASLASRLWLAGPVVQVSPQWDRPRVGCWLCAVAAWACVDSGPHACDATSPGATLWVTGGPVRLVDLLMLGRHLRGGWPRVPGGHAWPGSPMPLGMARSGWEPPPHPLEAISGICTSNLRTQLDIKCGVKAEARGFRPPPVNHLGGFGPRPQQSSKLLRAPLGLARGHTEGSKSTMWVSMWRAIPRVDFDRAPPQIR